MQCSTRCISSVPLFISPKPSGFLMPRWCNYTRNTARFRQSSSSSHNPMISHVRKTYYDYFPNTCIDGPPPSGRFNIDKHTLHREFLQLQATAHPDRHVSTGKERAEHESANINEAYNTLVNPLLRAQYLLKLRDKEIDKYDTSFKQDTEMLDEMMEVQESIEEAIAAAAENDGALLRIHHVHNENKIEASLQQIGKAFENDDLNTAKSETIRLKYLMNIRSQLS